MLPPAYNVNKTNVEIYLGTFHAKTHLRSNTLKSKGF